MFSVLKTCNKTQSASEIPKVRGGGSEAFGKNSYLSNIFYEESFPYPNLQFQDGNFISENWICFRLALSGSLVTSPSSGALEGWTQSRITGGSKHGLKGKSKQKTFQVPTREVGPKRSGAAMAITLLLPDASPPLPQLPQWFKFHVKYATR